MWQSYQKAALTSHDCLHALNEAIRYSKILAMISFFLGMLCLQLSSGPVTLRITPIDSSKNEI